MTHSIVRSVQRKFAPRHLGSGPATHADERFSFKRTAAILGLASAIIGVALGGYQIAHGVRESWRVERQVKAALFAGDRFVAQDQFDAALRQYQNAAALARDNLTVQRRILDVEARRILHKAFVSDWDYDSALYPTLANRFPRDWPIEPEQIDGYLGRLYQVIALNPSIGDDADIILTEALVMKAGLRVDQALRVLERGRTLHPDDPRLLAEFGLLHGLYTLSGRHPDDAELQRSMEFVRRAIAAQPNELRFHFYLARLAQWGWERDVLQGPPAVSEAIRSFGHAGAATAESAEKAKLRGRADEKLIYLVGHTIEPSELTDDFETRPPRSTAGLSNDELIALLDPAVTRREGGDHFVLLARLYYARGDFAGAWAALKRRNWEINNTRFHCYNGAALLHLLSRVLEKGGFEPKALVAVRENLEVARSGDSNCGKMNNRG